MSRTFIELYVLFLSSDCTAFNFSLSLFVFLSLSLPYFLFLSVYQEFKLWLLSGPRFSPQTFLGNVVFVKMKVTIMKIKP